MAAFLTIVFGVLLWIIGTAISFIIIAGLIAIICWAAGWVFSWKLAIIIFIAILILRTIFSSSVTVNNQ